MSVLVGFEQIGDADRARVGGKAWALAAMQRAGLSVPDGACVPAEVYQRYVRATGLAERIMLELARKRFEDMRWEELWDAALRIRNLFLATPLPEDLATELLPALAERFGDAATVVRSSALAEDAAGTSFAGLHESYVNVRGIEAIAEHLRLVWASLWSDAALLYRQELGLDPADSAMAVVVQRIAIGERSGVAFSRAPDDSEQAVIEAVWGLNQGLVDGTVEPDRWLLDRTTGRVLTHTPATREQAVMPGAGGVELASLAPERRGRPPLGEADVPRVFDLARRAETHFGAPQDVEWTIVGDALHALQSRPITTGRSAEDDGSPYSRSWYLSLRRSFANLQALRARIEGEAIPALVAEAEELAQADLAGLADDELAAEIERRAARAQHWHGVYWEDFIPFAHGARLFGQLYNDALRPEDPYAFVDLLAGAPMVSMARNRRLEEMAALVRDRHLDDALEAGTEPPDDLAALLAEFEAQFGDARASDPAGTVRLVARMARREPRAHRRPDVAALEREFLAHFAGEQRRQAEELLDLGRASYRLRDDDNIYLGRIEAQVERAVAEARSRVSERTLPEAVSPADAARALRDPGFMPAPIAEDAPASADAPRIQERQLVGQPAGAGLARGVARVVLDRADLDAFEPGEILVCDALDPTMTFVVPLAEAVVERRGGMLIHGAIIAREYGLPCVTGVPDATRAIRTGDEITVDGYLGIVTISRPRGGPF